VAYQDGDAVFPGESDADELDAERIAGGFERWLRGGHHVGGQAGRRGCPGRHPAGHDPANDGRAEGQALPALPLATNPLLFFVFELYVDESGWAAHEATDHFKAAVKELLPRVARRERVPFVPFL